MLSLLLVSSALASTACSPAGTSGTPRPAPTSTPEQLASALVSAEAEASLVASTRGLDITTAVGEWTNDERLSAARRDIEAGKPLAAAHAARTAREQATKDAAPPRDLAALSHFEGVLFARAGVPDAAFEAFHDASEIEGPLRPHSLLRAVESAGSLGKHQTAVELASRIEESAISRARIDAAVIESLARAGSVADLRATARRLFSGALPRQPGWSLQALRVVKALANKPTLDHARLGIEIADWIQYDAPRGRGAGEARKLSSELSSRLPGPEQKTYRLPSDDELVRRGKRLADVGQGKRALAILDKLDKRQKGLSKAAKCTLKIARGDALGAVKRRGEAFTELALAVELCEGDALAEALYAAGRAASRGNRHTDSIKFFGRFEAAFPQHRLADDARLEGARSALEGGHTTEFRSMLSKMPDDYPQGDMIGDGLFTLALEAMERGAWTEARTHLERGSRLGRERVYTRAGRFSYFLGRAHAALGATKASHDAYAATFVEAPLSYYAALAASRLDVAEPNRSKTTLTALLADAKSVSVPVLDASLSTDPNVEAALMLAGLGDARGVEDALAALGVRDHSALPAFYSFGAKLLSIAGDAQGAHEMLRTSRERNFGEGKFDCDAIAFELPRGEARELYELAYPRLFSSEVEKAAAESDVPTALLYALMREESAFSPRARSVSNARGLVQIIPPTASSVARRLGLKYSDALLYEPEANLRIGARYMSGLRKRFGDAYPLAIAGYNAGPGAPANWIEDRPAWDLDLWVERIPYTETRNYVKRVWSSYFVYQVLYADALGEITSANTKVPDKRDRTAG